MRNRPVASVRTCASATTGSITSSDTPFACLPRRRRRSLVVFDRHFLDYLVDPERSRVRRGTWAARVLAAFLPRPRLTVVCTGDPEEIHARKRELPLEEVRRQVAEYEALARRRGFHVVRTQGDVAASVESVVTALFPEEEAA